MEYGTCSDCIYAVIRTTAQQTTIFCNDTSESVNTRDPYLSCSSQYTKAREKKDQAEWNEKIEKRVKKISAPTKSKGAKKAKK